MAAGDRIIVGMPVGTLKLQGDSEFTENQWGFDSGVRRWLTHPNTPKSQWPQRGEPDKEYTRMYVADVTDHEEESGLTEITAIYRGIMRQTGAVMKERILPGADIAMFNIPALQTGDPARFIAAIPKSACTREYVTATKPTLNGVSKTLTATWLPAAADFTLTFTPDPDNPPTYMYGPIGWRLDNRSWEDVAMKIFLVREDASYYTRLAS